VAIVRSVLKMNLPAANRACLNTAPIVAFVLLFDASNKREDLCESFNSRFNFGFVCLDFVVGRLHVLWASAALLKL
jgi:hypothetical protein